MTDRETIALYTARAGDYAKDVANPEPSERLTRFIAAVPAVAPVLDLGCGPGNSAAAMMAAGLEVDAIDASEGMVDVARARYGVSAKVGTFTDVDASRAYGGIWANFSLLHAPREDMPGHLARLRAALRPGGLLHIGLKTGTGQARDSLGRLYIYYTDAEITRLLSDAGFAVTERETGREAGFDGVVAPWIVVWAVRPA